MNKEKLKRGFFIASIIFKMGMCCIVNMNYLINKLYVFSLVYLFFNVTLINSIMKEAKNMLEIILIFSVYIDLAYSLLINFTFSEKIKDLFYFYHGTLGVYHIGINMLARSKFLNYSIGIYGIILFFHMFYLMRGDLTFFNIGFLAMQLFICVVIFLNIILGDYNATNR